MSAKDANDALRVGGTLIKNPANLTPPTYGGTVLGIFKDFFAMPFFRTSKLKAADDKHANRTVEALYLGESWMVSVEFRQWDADMMTTLFPNSVAGAGTRRLLQNISGSTFRAGTRLSNVSVSLLFAPDRVVTEAPHLLLYRCLPALEEQAELFFMATEETTFPAVFEAIPNTSGHVYQFGLLSDMSLTP